jgi:hypothetical protein
MNLNVVIVIFRIVIFIAAVVAAWFGIMLLFFYDRFQIFNEMINSNYFVGEQKYGNGSGYKMDSWIMGWHTVIAVFVLLAAGWLFWTFFNYMSY